MKYLLIMNPGSRSGKGKRLWSLLESRLTAAVEYETAITERVGHAVELARNAKTDVVVAVGGDGTINEVLDGVIQSGNPDLRMGVLYSGTSPDFCKFHGIPIDPEHAADALLEGRSCKVDVARIAHHDAAGAELVAHFGCSCNIGMGAAIAGFANRWRRRLGDVLGTGTGALAAIARNARVDLDLVVDGEPMSLKSVNNLTIAKNPHIASGLKLRLDLTPSDGKLFIVGIFGKSRLGQIGLLPRFYNGSASTAPGVLVRECRFIEVTSSQPQRIEFDGDPRGFLPVRIEILPKALSLIGGAND